MDIMELDYEDIYKGKDKLSKNYMDFNIDLVNYLRNLDFNIPPTSIVELYNMMDCIDIFDMKEFINVSKCLFCSSELEYKFYEDLVYKFILDRFKEIVDEIKNQKRGKIKKEMDLLKSKIESDKKKIMEEAMIQKQEYIKKIMVKNKGALSEHKELLSKLNKNEKEFLEEMLKQEEDDIFKGLVLANNDSIEVFAKDKEKTEEYLFKPLNNLMTKNISDKNYMQINEIIMSTAELSKFIKNGVKRQESKANNKVKELDNELSQKLGELENTSLKIKKDVLEHREGAFRGKNAIQTIVDISSKKINNLDEGEYQTLVDYIRLNAPKFRTKISRSMKQSKTKIFDYKKTIEKSRKYQGLPMEFCYKKPMIKKYKLFCILDISGSVAKHLNLLSSFIYEISSVFNGGVNVYGFVSDLIDFTEMYRTEYIETVNQNMRGHRGYSSYEKALDDFYEDYFRLVDRNTIIIFFGDARNNQNKTNVEVLSKMKEKSKAIFWLNPEEMHKWNSDDSIIAKYTPYVKEVYEVSNVGQLLNFLENVVV